MASPKDQSSADTFRDLITGWAEGDGEPSALDFFAQPECMTMSMSSADPIHNERFPDLFRDEVFRLETRRLWLRWPKSADAAMLGEIVAVAACAHGEARWPLAWDGLVGSVPAMVLRMRAANTSGEGCFFVLADKAQPDQPIGIVGIDTLATGGPSLGFLLDVRRQGFGLMTEAARAVVSATHRYAGIDRIRSDASMSGLGARRVFEKAGFRLHAQRENATSPMNAMEARREAVRNAPSRGERCQPGMKDSAQGCVA